MADLKINNFKNADSESCGKYFLFKIKVLNEIIISESLPCNLKLKLGKNDLDNIGGC